jgi:hypothetical protein
MCRATFLAFIALVFLSGCTKDKSSLGNCPQGCSAVSFKADIIPIFATNCALTGCHDAVTAYDHVALDSAQAYVSAMQPGVGYVVPGNPSASILLGQLYPNVTNHMPNNGKQLDACSIQEISCWIQQGALNN